VLWSGGIDTTAVVVALLKAMEDMGGRNSIAYDKVEIRWCQRSVAE